jgi:hypothetical protein
MQLWLRANPKTAQQIKQSFIRSSFRCCLWSEVVTLVELLHEHREGRCRAFEAEVPPDHTLAQRLQLVLQLRSSGMCNEQLVDDLLGALICSYLHLPSEELNARLVPEEVRMRCVGKLPVEEWGLRSGAQEEGKWGGGSEGGKEGKWGGGSEGGKEGRGGKGLEMDSNGGKGCKMSSKGKKDDKAHEMNCSGSSSSSGAGGDNKGEKDVDQRDQGSSSRADPVKDGGGRGNKSRHGESAGGIKDQNEKKANIGSSRSSNGAMGRGGSGKDQSKPGRSRSSRECGSSRSCANQSGTGVEDGVVNISNSRKGNSGSSSASSSDVGSGGTGGRSSSSSSGGREGRAAANVANNAGPSDSSKPGNCEQPGLSGRVRYGSSSHSINSSLGWSMAGSRIEKLESQKKEDEDGDQLDSLKESTGGLSPKTMWEIVQQNAAAAEYLAEVLADEVAAETRGEEPKVQLPFHFTWPGKPLEDVFAHGLFNNLPVGGLSTALSLDSQSSSLGDCPTALHVQLVLELLLLCWPDPQIGDFVTVSGADQEVYLMEHIAGLRWEWLLLICALLQQMSSEQKQQILQERGPLLMQLLHQVLLEDEGLGGAGIWELLTASGEMGWLSWYLAVTGSEDLDEWLNDRTLQWAGNVPMAVTMVLQNLLFESLPECLVDPETARIGKVIQLPGFGKCGTCGLSVE